MPYDLLAGQMMFQFGQEAAHANRSAMPADVKEQRTAGTSGQSCTDSSQPVSLQSRLANRLRAKMDVNGSPEYVLTWKELDMKSGPPICALRASGRRTSDKGCTGGGGKAGCSSGDAGGVANLSSGRRREELQNNRRGNEGNDSGEVVGCSRGGAISRVGDSKSSRPQGHAWNGDNRHQPGWINTFATGSVTETGSFGHWSDYDILYCLDGKARRIESSTFPLANGVPGRVAQLRGLGNAIVPQVAAKFIEAFMECARGWGATHDSRQKLRGSFPA